MFRPDSFPGEGNRRSHYVEGAVSTQELRMLSEQVQRFADPLLEDANDLDACLALGMDSRYCEQALNKARQVEERLIRVFCEESTIEWNSHNLYGTIDKLALAGFMPRVIALHLHDIRVLCNTASHDQDDGAAAARLGSDDVANAVRLLLRVFEWFYCQREPCRLESLYQKRALVFGDRVDAFIDAFHRRYRPYGADEQALADPAQIYIPLRCRPITSGEAEPVDALDWIRAGLTPGRGQLLLADYGMGKSFVALRLFLLLAELYRAAPDEEPIPVLFPLRRYRLVRHNPKAILGAIYDFLVSNSFPVFTVEDLSELLKEGRLVIILDGIDEIPLVQTVADPLDLLEHLDLSRFGPCPWLATSRKGIFARVLSDPDRFEQAGVRVAQLLAWDDHQWRAFVEACDRDLGLFAGGEGGDPAVFAHQRREAFLQSVAGRPQLQQLTVTPLYARMLVEARGELLRREDLNVVQLYAAYVDVVLAGRGDVAMLADMEMRRQCLESLAVHFFRTDRASCSPDDLVEVADGYVRDAGRRELLSFVQTELQTYSLLNCDALGFFSFSHKSFYEYFLARAVVRFVRAEGWTTSGSLLEKRLGAGECRFIADLLAEPGNESVRADLLRLLAEAGTGTGELRRNLVAIELGGGRRLARAQLDGLNLSGLDFAGCCLQEASLADTQCIGVDFSGADMRDCVLIRANLERCCLARADLSGARLDFATLTDIEPSPETPGLAGASLMNIVVTVKDKLYLSMAVEGSMGADDAWRERARRQLEQCVTA